MEDFDDETESGPRDGTALARFIWDLELNMLGGWNERRCQEWAKTRGVDVNSFLTLYYQIKSNWRTEPMTLESFNDRRDMARARYLSLYVEARRRGNILGAIAANDRIVKLDGLDQPSKLHITVSNEGDAPRITNSARDKVAQLVGEMKKLTAPKSDSEFDQDVADDHEEEDPGQNGHTNGTNGHTNGVIEIEGTYPGERKK